jgi:hypothetical protein
VLSWAKKEEGSLGTAEYYLEAELGDGQKIVHPATAPGINQTVVAW